MNQNVGEDFYLYNNVIDSIKLTIVEIVDCD